MLDFVARKLQIQKWIMPDLALIIDSYCGYELTPSRTIPIPNYTRFLGLIDNDVYLTVYVPSGRMGNEYYQIYRNDECVLSLLFRPRGIVKVGDWMLLYCMYVSVIWNPKTNEFTEVGDQTEAIVANNRIWYCNYEDCRMYEYDLQRQESRCASPVPCENIRSIGDCISMEHSTDEVGGYGPHTILYKDNFVVDSLVNILKYENQYYVISPEELKTPYKTYNLRYTTPEALLVDHLLIMRCQEGGYVYDLKHHELTEFQCPHLNRMVIGQPLCAIVENQLFLFS